MRHDFTSDDVVVTYDDEVCIHAGTCVAQLPAVFNLNKDPWIDPAAAPIGDLQNTVSACPSGALSIRNAAD